MGLHPLTGVLLGRGEDTGRLRRGDRVEMGLPVKQYRPKAGSRDPFRAQGEKPCQQLEFRPTGLLVLGLGYGSPREGSPRFPFPIRLRLRPTQATPGEATADFLVVKAAVSALDLLFLCPS